MRYISFIKNHKRFHRTKGNHHSEVVSMLSITGVKTLSVSIHEYERLFINNSILGQVVFISKLELKGKLTVSITMSLFIDDFSSIDFIFLPLNSLLIN